MCVCACATVRSVCVCMFAHVLLQFALEMRPLNTNLARVRPSIGLIPSDFTFHKRTRIPVVLISPSCRHRIALVTPHTHAFMKKN
jgi:hypothetical protein